MASNLSTPILDRETPPPPAPPVAPPRVRRKLSRGLIALTVVVGLIGFGAFSSWLLRQPQSTLDPAPPNEWLLLIWRGFELLLGITAVTAIHEIGHAVAGKLMDFRFVLMRVWMLQITLPFRIKWQLENPLPGSWRFVYMVPKSTQYLRSRSICFSLGGPLANLASCSLAFVAPGNQIVIWFVGLSAVMAVLNLIPYRERAFSSDGMRVLGLLFRSRQENRWLALRRLQADLQQGVQPEDLDAKFVQMAAAIEDPSISTVVAHVIAYARAFYKEDEAEVARLLEVCLKYSNLASPLTREGIFTNAATFQATKRKRIDLARQWQQELPKKTIIPGRHTWIEAAILEAQGDIQGVLKKLDEVETSMIDLPPEQQKAHLKGLRRWRAELGRKQRKVWTLRSPQTPNSSKCFLSFQDGGFAVSLIRNHDENRGVRNQ